MNVSAGNLKANVTAVLQGTDAGATAKDLDKSLRVGVKVGSDTKIFAPVTGFDPTYKVAGSTAGTTYTTMSSTGANANLFAGGTDVGINAAQVTIPKVTGDDTSQEGLLVEFYVWFEGEDSNCKSDNLLVDLNSYEINITFTDADL